MALTDIQIHELYPEQAALNEEAKSLLAELQALQPKLHAAQETQLKQNDESAAAIRKAIEAVESAKEELSLVTDEETSRIRSADRVVKSLEHEFRQKTERRQFVKAQYKERNEEIQRIESAKAKAETKPE